MNVENMLLVVLAALTLYNLGVQAYIHFEAYPLLAYVGKSEFTQYLAEYEKRLTLPLLLPYVLTLLTNLVVIFIHHDDVPVIGLILAFVLNLAVSLGTLFVATPVYERVKTSTNVAADMKPLMKINLGRLLLSLAAGLVVLYLLLTLMPD
jgi:hypothetical protein